MNHRVLEGSQGAEMVEQIKKNMKKYRKYRISIGYRRGTKEEGKGRSRVRSKYKKRIMKKRQCKRPNGWYGDVRVQSGDGASTFL
jgi:hypothetical protein